MAKKITILGAGPGGYVAAIRAAQLGAQVTVVEAEDVGGTCLNRGCIPSKIMITSARMLEKFRQAKEFGIEVDGEFRLNMAGLMARKNSIVQNQVKGIRGLFKHHHIEFVQGKGFIRGPYLAGVKTPDGKEIDIKWDKLILATGTLPLNVPAFPFDGEMILSSNHALSLEEIPQSVLIVGGGVIGCEFAFMLSSLGAKVIVVEMMERLLPLPSIDSDCSKILQREMKKKKIRFILNQQVEAVGKKNQKLRVTLAPAPFESGFPKKEDKPLVLEADKMLVCIGRQPNTNSIGLERIGVKPDDRGWIIVNDRMETQADDVYAVGDILGPSKIMLAHVASSEGQVAADNAMGIGRVMDYSAVPGAIFTMPEVANVGLTESQAKEKGLDIRADRVLFRTLGKAHVIGEIAGQIKVISETAGGRIRGVHIIGPQATDLIAEATLAMQMGASVQDLAATIHAHPTIAEIMVEASYKALDQAVHG